MEASAFLELQETWLNTNELQNPIYTYSAFHRMSSEYVFQQGRAHSEISMDAHNMESPNEGNGGFDTPAYASEKGFHMGNSEEDALMMDRPFLDYINEMLMDEVMEDRTFMQQDCISYQAIVNSFYNIISEHSDPIQSALNSDNVSLYNITGRGNGSLLSNIDESSERIGSSSKSDTLSFCDGISEHSPPMNTSSHSENPSAPTSNSCGSDEVWLLEPSDNANSLYATVSEHAALIRLSSSSDNCPVLSSDSHNSNGLLRDGHPICHEYSWIDRSLNSNTTPLAATHGNSSDGHISFVNNKDLNVEADYERLYVDREQTPSKQSYAKDKQQNGLAEGKPCSGQADDKQRNRRTDNKGHNGHADIKPRNRRADANGKKGATAGSMSGKQKGKSNGKLEVGVALDLKELLVSCAQAVAVGDARTAAEMLQELWKNGASPNGSGLHRAIYYFCEALQARMHGTGSRVCSEMASRDRPSAAKLLTAFKTSCSVIPFFKIAHYFANQSILKAAKGATRLHIIDYGILYGLQWPCLINALADRKEGPPKLVITGIEFPQPGANPTEGLVDIGRRLTEYAKACNVPFEYHAIATSNWEDVNPLSHSSGYGQEVLVVNCMNRLRHVLDESVNASSSSTSSPRQKLLEAVCSLNPDLFVVAVLNAAYNSPFFVTRFREALHYYSSKFDMMETTWDNSPERMMMERDCMYHDILNVVACEGFERVQRPESYKQWQARIQRAGFEQMPLMPSVLSMSRSYVQNHYHTDFHIDHDSNRWMLLGWKGRTFEAVSAWKPRAAHN